MRKCASTSDEYGDEWFQLKIAAGETITLEYKVDDRLDAFDSSLRWAFDTEGYDIGFSLNLNGEKGKSDSIIAYQRVDSHLDKQGGNLRLEKPGKYVLTFDNSYSRSRSKILNYSVTLTQVDATEIMNKKNKSNNNEFNLTEVC